MAIVSAVVNSFKVELLGMATHQAGDAYMIAVYTSLATLNKSTTVYSSTDEVVGAGYVAGGQALVGFSVTGDLKGSTGLKVRSRRWRPTFINSKRNSGSVGPRTA